MLSGEEQGLGNNIPIPNIKHSSAEWNLVNVVLIDDRLHHCIMIRLRMRTREELGLTDSADYCAFHDSPLLETRLNEQTNK